MEPQDNRAFRFPVSVKGVVLRGARVVLLRNEREEWELPGGKLEPTESPERCVVREIEEELALAVAAERLLDAWVYTIAPGTRVLIVTYGCSEPALREARLSDEHRELRWFDVGELDGLPMPEGYRRSIRAWAAARG
jgi:8-oxo-dGTP pyrophosphatase MutT (NUDIX family)